MEEPIPDKPKDYTDNGTAMHTIAASCLQYKYPAAKRIGEDIFVHSEGEPQRTVEFTEEMADLVQGYVDTINKLAAGNELWIEQRVDFSEFVDVEAQFGTADAIIYFKDQGELGIFDLKTGHTPVQVSENSQLMIYALGALRMLMDEDLATVAEGPFAYARSIGINQIRMGIYQPKQREGMWEWSCDLSTLAEFALVLAHKAKAVEAATKKRGTMPEEQWQKVYLNPKPNEVECAFCKALPTCPASARAVQEAVGADFQAIVDEPESVHVPPKFLGTHEDDDQELSFKMRSVGFVEDWCLAVRAEVERRLLSGVAVPGFGLELGRKPPRRWSSNDVAEEMLRTKFRATLEQVYNMKLKSPTQLELLCDRKKNEKPVLGPRQWKMMQALITQGEPSPSVKPASVIKNPYVAPKPDASAFTAVDATFDCDLV
jgi:hypothetical protein